MSASFVGGNFQLVELVLWNRNTYMSFTESLSSASSFKKKAEEKNNLKFPDRRSRHPLKGEVVLFLRICTNIETVVRLYHMIRYLLQTESSVLYIYL